MTITDFLKYVLPDVVGCPTASAKQAVLDAATEFLTFTGAWNEIQDPIGLSNLSNEYDLEALPTGARCIDIRAIFAPFVSGGELRPATMAQINAQFPNWATQTSNLPSHYTRAFDFTTIRVFPIPDNASGQVLRVHAVYTLKADATTIPDEIVERYREVIASGAKARLMVMAKVPWQDLTLASYHRNEFSNGKAAAKITAEHGKTRGEIRVPARRFGP